ncbi:MAG: glycine zipper family protein [Aquificae bacterium]|nr:glycine zipper family protein [Aquificota bacterium]
MKKLISFFIIMLLISMPVKKSYAVSGEIIFRDAMYGGVIGFLTGTAVYAIDQDNFGKKIGTGVLVGILLGTAFGVYEATGYLSKNDSSMFARILRRLHLQFLNGEDKEVYTFAGIGILDQRF